MAARSLRGTPVVPGAGYGPAVRPMPRPEPAAAMSAAASDPDTELERLTRAVTAVTERLNERAGHVSGPAADVLRTGAAMAEDPGLRAVATEAIREGRSASQALWGAAAEFTAAFRAAGGLMAERVTDLEDIRDRVAAELLGLPEPGVPVPDVPSVLLAEDLAPADAALLDPELITAIAVRLGGPTSHTAIIARQLGIPCVVGVGGLDAIGDDVAAVLVDGTAGTVAADPDPQAAAEHVDRAREQAAAAAAWRGEGATSDGHAVDLLANVQDGAGARAAATGVAVGVGLMRTELTFLASAAEPSVEHQSQAYGEVLRAFPDAKVIIRTLDAGSDKPLPFVDFEDESNPALGIRGLRIAADDPGILDRQLDAVAAAAEESGARRPLVMAPMVATVAEARFFAERARARDLVPGIMIEVPAAALLAEALLAEVDFVSIGTNDLSQYTMAADRLSPALSRLCDPWQPAVLTLIELVGRAGRAAGKPVGVCGEAAADPLLACVLVGMGVTSLSAAPIALPAVGARLETVTLAQCERAAAAVLATTSADDARAAAAAEIDGA